MGQSIEIVMIALNDTCTSVSVMTMFISAWTTPSCLYTWRVYVVLQVVWPLYLSLCFQNEANSVLVTLMIPKRLHLVNYIATQGWPRMWVCMVKQFNRTQVAISWWGAPFRLGMPSLHGTVWPMGPWCLTTTATWGPGLGLHPTSTKRAGQEAKFPLERAL